METATQEHPLAAAARQNAIQTNTEKQQLLSTKKARLDMLTKMYGLSFFRVIPNEEFRGMTVAYTCVQGDVVEIATALVHPKDEKKYTKLDGNLLAAEAYDRGQNIPLKKPRIMNAKQYVGVVSRTMAFRFGEKGGTNAFEVACIKLDS